MTAFLSEYHKRDRGFTLVEVLIVIAVIALLVSMTSFAAYQALLYTKERAIIAEIGLMSAALETYKETRNSYPPCMAAVFWGTLSQPTMPTYSYYLTRQAAMNNHTQPAYNNMTINTTTFVTANSSGIFTYKYYNLTPSGQVVKLDMNTIDPAEALVFWLAGFPCPYITTMNGYIAPKKLIGFSKNQSNPFTVTFTPTMSSNQFLSMRTTPLFDFDERRLGDCDNDGWYEYYPEKPDFSATPTAPYVYYDAQLYTSWKMPPAIATQMAPMVGYPPAQNYIPNMLGRNQTWAQNWGVAMPYARSINTTSGTIAWINPTSFQIIAPGFDRQYGVVPASLTLLQPISLQPRVLQDTMLPTDVNGNQPDRDNFTNFTDQKLGDELSAQGASQLQTGS